MDIVDNGTMDDVVIEANNIDVFHIHDKLLNAEMRNLTVITDGWWKNSVYVENYGFLAIENVNIRHIVVSML